MPSTRCHHLDDVLFPAKLDQVAAAAETRVPARTGTRSKELTRGSETHEACVDNEDGSAARCGALDGGIPGGEGGEDAARQPPGCAGARGAQIHVCGEQIQAPHKRICLDAALIHRQPWIHEHQGE